jgi:branched-chain amino acid transport system permease protein
VNEILVILLNGASQAAILFLIASGMSLVFGVMGVLNFAHGAFYMLGAYFAARILANIDAGPVEFLAVCVAATLGVAILGLIVDALIFRRLYGREALAGLLATFGLLYLLQGSATKIFGALPLAVTMPKAFSGSWTIGTATLPYYNVVLYVACVVVAVFLYYLFSRSRFGRVVSAVARDPEMAAAVGIEVRLVRSAVIFIGAGLAGLAGALYSPLVSVNTGLAVDVVVESFAIVVVAGLGVVWGTFPVALVFGFINAALLQWAPQWESYTFYVVMALVLVLRPQGLFGSKAALVNA